MAYAALVSVIQLLEDNEIHFSLKEEFGAVKETLKDYSPEDERRIRDAACKAQGIIETEMSRRGYDESFKRKLEKVETDVDKVMMNLKWYTSHEDHSAGTAEVGTSAVRSKARYWANELSRSILILQNTSHGDPHPSFIRYKEQITSVIKTLSRFQGLLRGHSPKHIDKERAHSLETQIDSAIVQANGIDSKVKARSEYCESLEQVREEVEFISRKTMRSHIPKEYQKLKKGKEVVGASTQAPTFDSTVGASKMRAVSGKNTVVGLDECLMTKIKAQLCGGKSKLQVVSIVGMGGVGKTTWAGNIFDDKLIREKFDRRAWVTVSQHHHLRKFLLAIVSSLNMNNIKGLRVLKEHGLKHSIYKHLYGRRYLIIMDDVWLTKFSEIIEGIFPDTSNGSRLMITTRQSVVASNASKPDFIHHIPILNELQSWNLFCDGVFCPPELEHIGRSIARKCGGLPLAIVVIAGLLSKSNMRKDDWEKIEMNISSAMTKYDEHFPEILSLSYNFMPHHLKPCFLHLGGFPEDCKIQASQLIKLWVAEGFVERPTEPKSLEEVAEGYLEDLVDRNLVLITKRKSSGKIKYCSIHDLLRDLCLQISRQENFLHVINKNDVLNSEQLRNVRRLYINSPYTSVWSSEVKNYSRLIRSLYSFTHAGDYFLSVASDFELLSVLNLVGGSASARKIEELLHLRYLGLSYLPVHPSISNLQNLETLVLDGDHTVLPSEFWNMQCLRHVIIRHMTLPPVPQGAMIIDGVPLLGRLQTLSKVVDFIFTRDEVEMIPSLKKLKVLYKEASKSWNAFGLGNLVRLSQLETLHIEISLRESDMNIPVEPLPLNFGFSDSLKSLSLSGCRLPWRDMTVVGSLPNLQVLKLRLDAFLGEEWETIEGQFLKLKFLLMEKLLYLKDWRSEITHFPCLEHLIIRNCQRLQEIPSEIGDISTLGVIEVYGSRLAAGSALWIQEEQRDKGNDALQVHV